MNWLGQQRFDGGEEGTDVAWMVTYADMMTIILTFMILLLSISTIAQTKYEVIVEEFTGEHVDNLHDVRDKVDEIVENAGVEQEVDTELDDDGLTIEFSDALLFPTGSDELRERAEPVFEPIRDHLANDLDPHYGVIIEGHTDDVPIETDEFDSNWELSTARAIHVKDRLVAAGLDRRRLSVEGYAETRPATDVDLLDEEAVDQLSDRELEEVRSANRRVVIRVDTLPPDRVEQLLDDSDETGETDVPGPVDDRADGEDGDSQGPFGGSDDNGDEPEEHDSIGPVDDETDEDDTFDFP